MREGATMKRRRNWKVRVLEMQDALDEHRAEGAKPVTSPKVSRADRPRLKEMSSPRAVCAAIDHYFAHKWDDLDPERPAPENDDTLEIVVEDEAGNSFTVVRRQPSEVVR
jgi:hypothetical protein